MMIDVDEVKVNTGINPKHLNFNEDESSKLDEILTNWILQSEDLIKSYTHNPRLLEDTPAAVKNVCLRLTMNMVALAIERRDTPRTKVTDWRISVSSAEIFEQTLKDDLEPFKIDKSNSSDTIDIFAITGD